MFNLFTFVKFPVNMIKNIDYSVHEILCNKKKTTLLSQK